MKHSDADKTKASFKLDLIETAAADPVIGASDLRLLIAYASVIEWPSGRTWLAWSLASAKTGLSERQFRQSRDGLRGNNEAKRAYLRPARRGGEVVAYTLVNPWMDESRAHVQAMLKYHRAVAAEKKANQRLKMSRQNLQGQEEACPGKICRSVPAKSAAYYPSVVPQEDENGREDISGSNVLPFNRRAS